jgi:hypothetical protein
MENEEDKSIKHDIDSGIKDFSGNDIVTWTTRKRIAIACLCSMFIVMGVLLFFVSVDKITALREIISNYFYTMSFIIVGYFGSTSLSYYQYFGKKDRD